MVKSIKNQTLPAEKKTREDGAGICERENSFLFKYQLWAHSLVVGKLH